MSIEDMKADIDNRVVKFIPKAAVDDPDTQVLGDLSDDGLALALVNKHPNTRWVEESGRCRDWNNIAWVETPKHMMLARARVVCRDAAVDEEDKEAKRLKKRADRQRRGNAGEGRSALRLQDGPVGC